MPRSQYLIARTQLLADLKSRSLIHPGIILHAAGVVIDLAKCDDLLLGSEVDVVGCFRSYVEDVRALGTLEPARDVFDGWRGGYGGLGFKSHDTPEMEQICAAVHTATFAAFAERMRLTAPEFFDRLSHDPASYAGLHQYGVEEGHYADAPILHHLDVDAFAGIAVNDWAVNGALLAALVCRFDGDSRQGALLDEHVWVERLRSKLEAVAAAAEPPYRHLLEIRLAHYFDEIAKAVNSAKQFLAASRAEEMRDAASSEA